MKFISGLVILTLWSCQTQQNTIELAEQDAPMERWSGGPTLSSTCVSQDRACAENFDPTLCQGKFYQGREIPQSVMPVAWGENICFALENLQKTVCNSGLDPRLVAKIECIPDTSRGVCPPRKVPCPEGVDQRPMYCFSNRYQGQQVGLEQGLVAWGKGRCATEWQLRMNMCQANLNPDLMGPVVCREDPLATECIGLKVQCRDTLKKTLCLGSLKVPGQKVEATGSSECAARFLLAEESCRRQAAPSELRDIVCR